MEPSRLYCVIDLQRSLLLGKHVSTVENKKIMALA